METLVGATRRPSKARTGEGAVRGADVVASVATGDEVSIKDEEAYALPNRERLTSSRCGGTPYNGMRFESVDVYFAALRCCRGSQV